MRFQEIFKSYTRLSGEISMKAKQVNTSFSTNGEHLFRHSFYDSLNKTAWCIMHGTFLPRTHTKIVSSKPSANERNNCLSPLKEKTWHSNDRLFSNYSHAARRPQCAVTGRDDGMWQRLHISFPDYLAGRLWESWFFRKVISKEIWSFDKCSGK